MPSLEQQPTYWRSLNELSNTPEFQGWLEREFSDQSLPLPTASSRRRFIQLMGASFALATGAAACRWEKETILPFGRRPMGVDPGKRREYATAYEFGGVSRGVVVSCYDGRPVKIEPHAEHPSGGGTDPRAQASTLGLYDPDRSTRPALLKSKGGDRSWGDFETFLKPLVATLAEAQGEGVAVLAEPSSSPTQLALLERIRTRMPQARVVEFTPLSCDNSREGSRLAFGLPHRVHPHLDRASVILSLDADFLGEDPRAMQNAPEFMAGRDPARAMNRLYVVESNYSQTGAYADHRLPVRSEQVEAILQAVAARLSGSVAPAGELFADAKVARFVEVVAADLKSAGASALLLVGERQSPEAHALAHQINASLGAVGRTVDYTVDREPLGDFPALVSAMSAGQIKLLLILGGNPVFDAPADLDFAAALSRVEHSVHLSLYRDETSLASEWHLPAAHYLESWGDGRAYDGTLSLQQPMIQPLYGSRSNIEVLAMVLGEPWKGYTLVRQTFETQVNALDKESAWRKAIHDGFVAGTAAAVVSPAARATSARALPARVLKKTVANGELELVFKGDTRIHDGRFANNSWLQETPDFMTNLVWDNGLLMNPTTAKALGFEHEDRVRVEVGGRAIEAAIFVMPGQALGSITVSVGYGRRAAGFVGGSEAEEIEAPGFDVYPLRTREARWAVSGVKLSRTTGKYLFATTQDHYPIDTIGQKGIEERLPELIREETHEGFKKNPNYAKERVHHNPLESLWKEHDYEDQYRWGLAIDLNKCIGCNACMVACQSENNIAVVGKEQVLMGREMSWIRIDRYFSGSMEEPRVVHQPMTCQQCENAPCEQVCPVGATMHSREGLNDMVYNRCIGTRYCANNCPYKVRRFNYLNFWKKNIEKPENEVQKLSFNPDVTVRMRGVMEKCTYCVQRIQSGKITAKNARRKVADGEIKSACQTACPTQAIVFGDLSDPKSRVHALRNDSRSYDLLAELNVKPRTFYLGRIRNPHPELMRA